MGISIQIMGYFTIILLHSNSFFLFVTQTRDSPVCSVQSSEYKCRRQQPKRYGNCCRRLATTFVWLPYKCLSGREGDVRSAREPDKDKFGLRLHLECLRFIFYLDTFYDYFSSDYVVWSAALWPYPAMLLVRFERQPVAMPTWIYSKCSSLENWF